MFFCVSMSNPLASAGSVDSSDEQSSLASEGALDRKRVPAPLVSESVVLS